MNNDTIAAIATGLSTGGIHIIRISGDDSVCVAKKIFKFRNKKNSFDNFKSHTLYYGNICDSEEIIDEVLLSIMKGPHSYTKEDVVEINCHGGIFLTKRILELVLKSGARLAEPGEFTKRAFLNGRIDLSQAEAVMDLIDSKSERARKQAISQLSGSLKNKIHSLRESILKDTAYIEAALDDPEHISLDGFSEKLLSNVNKNLFTVKELLKTSGKGKLTKEGIRTVILGKPNVGKSSLMNVLLGEDRAIVTDIEGTTRDTLEESVRIGDLFLNIVDTAGVRKTKDTIEQIGVERSMKAAETADLILFIIDGNRGLDENDEAIINFIKGRTFLVIKNKSDLKEMISEEEIVNRIGKKSIVLSARNEEGFDDLYNEINNLFFEGTIFDREETYVTSERQKEALNEVKGSLEQVVVSIENEMPEDFFTIDLMNAYSALGRIIGEEVDEDLIDTIFREFCMGK